MKRIFVAAVVLLFATEGFAQAKWDSAFRPNGYALHVDFFKSYADSPDDIIFLGNSITAGVEWMELLGNKNARNRGISGDITYGILERIEEITAGRPAKVFILIGINDIARNIPDSLILNNYERMVRFIKKASPTTKIYLQTLLPVNNEFQPARNHFNKDEKIRFVNEGMKKIATNENVTLIDLHPHFLNAQGKLEKSFTHDGLHLNAAGYRKWSGILQQYLDEPAFDKQGHRGARGLVPENTIPSMLTGIDLGATTVELDVVVSGDRQVVVSHDVFFHHNISTTPDGKTLTSQEAAKYLLYGMKYDSIKKFDVGRKPHPDFVQQKKMSVYKPLLSDLIDAVERYSAEKGRTVRYNIEIKSKKENDGKKHPPVEEFVDLVMQVINSKALSGRAYIQSFDPRAIQVVHKKYPTIETALLIDGSDKRTVDQQLNELGFTPTAYSPHFMLVNEELVKECRERKMKLIPWTVNDANEMRRLIALGVDGIITDYPDLFNKL